MNKKEMIEEIRHIMCSEDCEECAKETADYHGITLEQARNQSCIICEYAKVLYNAGYRKIPEGSVVLSKEEYNEIKQYQTYIPEMKKAFDKVHNNARKETAKEILQELLGYIGSSQQFCIVNDGHKTLIDCDKLFGFIEELAKQFGVEEEE